MATYFRLVDVSRQFFDSNGDTLAGGKIYTYSAGTTTDKATYVDNAGNAAHTNPIILDAAGRIPDEIWGTTGGYDFKITDSADVTIDTPGDIVGINDTAAASGSEWIDSALTPTFVDADTFTFAGDQTTVFHPGRRLKITDSGGTDYANITTSSYSDPNTTINVVLDSGSIDSGISAVAYGITSKINTSVPFGFHNTAVATTSGTSVTIDSNVPSWANRITLMFKGVSTSGGNDWLIQLGPTGGLETTGYDSVGVSIGASTANNSSTVGFLVNISASADMVYGQAVFTKYDGNEWVMSSVMGSQGSGAQSITGSGYKSLAGVLTQISITTTGGSNTFDSGAIRAFYE